MKIASDFRALEPSDTTQVPVRFNDAPLKLTKGENLAAQLLAAGVLQFRKTAVSGKPRSPYCMMGACFECLVFVDGTARQACMTEVTEGMEIVMHTVGNGDDA